ncbi:glucose 1-dehydrogenase 1-like [Cydia fagiglandana]|uniref:glucose 1-dehydrogenase 1-like n=1 Tax=Cydia fagiglandana TaxID=1458189 RepID=UPI002FEE1BFB
MDFKNKVVIVTGGSCGIGAEIAIQFAKQSAKVVIVGRNEERLRNIAEQCEGQGEALAIKADLTIDSEVERVVEETIIRFGQIDVLINNAGIVKNTKIQEGIPNYDKIFNTNLRSVYLLTSLAVPHLIKTKGNIINISSAAGQKIFPTLTVYCMSKAALDMFTKGLAVELAPSVRANAINPGPVKTDIFVHAGLEGGETVIDAYGAATLLGKCSACKEIADMALYLASDKANSITGSTFVIDNGFILK